MELLIGAGSRHDKLLSLTGTDWDGLVTLDNVESHKPDVLHDLNVHPLPFEDNSFSSIHAYDVLEHLGRQGDYEFFFREFSEYWRILEPGGIFYGKVPADDSPGLWGDPSHVRVINDITLAFLSQKAYQDQVGRTPMSDFRHIYKADFYPLKAEKGNQAFVFALRAIKD